VSGLVTAGLGVVTIFRSASDPEGGHYHHMLAFLGL
jgi:hypothetical protein